MVQMRCPECGYLQTLSEERFLTISEDFLNCPHCHARVPKEWAPIESDSVPEEARHKILAFSRRILNGGDVGREVVYALEGLVRHHGPMESSNKALGIGYAGLGEMKKGEEFLVQACLESPGDIEILRCLLKVLPAQDKFREAVEVGRSIIDISGTGVLDEDVARTVSALIGEGNMDEARTLIDSYPNLDSRNTAVKQARKELNRAAGQGLGSFFGGKGSIHRLLGVHGAERLKSLTHRARNFIHLPAHTRPARGNSTAFVGNAPVPKNGDGATECRAFLPVTIECWIYTRNADIPKWQDVRDSLAQQYIRKADREQAFKFLELLIQKNDLTIDYVVKTDAQDLFHYPEDLIPQNSRGLTDEDRQIVMEADMIVRVRLSYANRPLVNPLIFMVKFVEAARRLTGGVVQDAVSHTLWGIDQWTDYVQNPEENLIELQVNFEVLDEGKYIWIHSHGMQKFGLPDLEMEGISSELASTARKFMVMAASILVKARQKSTGISSPVAVPNSSLQFHVERREPDEEGHFPVGSLRIIPSMVGIEATGPDSANDVMKKLRLTSGPQSFPDSSSEEEQSAEETGDLRTKMLDAHNKALHNLTVFKKSFRRSRNAEGQVHAVKVGFPAQGGEYEWMWVSLNAWSGGSLVGFLQNSPVLRKDLQKGSLVKLNDGDIFDWVIVNRGDVLGGAYTEKIVAS